MTTEKDWKEQDSRSAEKEWKPLLPTTVSLDRIGRYRWKIWASTIPAGGTRVDTWIRWGRKRALRMAERVSEARNREPRHASDSMIPPGREPQS